MAELGEDGQVAASFVYATRGNVPDYMVRGGRTFRLITDQVGSVRLVVDAQSGSVEQEIEYDAFGRVLSDSNPGFQPFGFAGGIYDSDTGLTHFGAREYDAELGRWTSADPISFAGGDGNLYGYVVQDPVDFVDPAGTDWIDSSAQSFMGFGDSLTWGGSARLRRMVGLDNVVKRCSLSYRAGSLAGNLASLLGGYGEVRAASSAARSANISLSNWKGFVTTFGGGPARWDELVSEARAAGNARLRTALVKDLLRKFYAGALQSTVAPVIAGDGIPGTSSGGICGC